MIGQWVEEGFSEESRFYQPLRLCVSSSSWELGKELGLEPDTIRAVNRDENVIFLFCGAESETEIARRRYRITLVGDEVRIMDVTRIMSTGYGDEDGYIHVGRFERVSGDSSPCKGEPEISNPTFDRRSQNNSAK